MITLVDLIPSHFLLFPQRVLRKCTSCHCRHGGKSTICLLIRVYDAVKRIPVFSMPSRSAICCSPSSSYAALESVPWMGWERKGPLWQGPTQLGKPSAHSHALMFLAPSPYPTGEFMDWEGDFLALRCAALGQVIWAKSNCSSYLLWCVQTHIHSHMHIHTHILCAAAVCWNFSGNLVLYKGSLL